MRIIAGKLGGRLFSSPHSHRTHPMSDRGRGALFNTLGDIEGLRVLDAFAGTGALSFEAVSRGASHATAIESDKSAQLAITHNISSLRLGNQVSLVRANAAGWLQTYSGEPFDIILLDPPYNDLQTNLLHKLTTQLRPTGILVLSWPASEPAPELPRLRTVGERQYGDMRLIYYRAL